jgi:adenylosuccinate lyase
MRAIWSDDGKYRAWLAVELAVCEVLAERGTVPADAVAEIRERAAVDPARVDEIEREVRHDVIAFLTALAEKVGPASRWVHWGMTSSDVLDTALALQIRDAGVLLRTGLDRMCDALRARALEFRHTPCVGRTHGVHAEPTTFGLKLLVFYAEMGRHRERLDRALAEAAVGKISGAVGTFAHLPPDVEEAVCQRLGIGFEQAATQVVQRDRHAHLVSVLAGVASGLEKIAVELRHLARTEVREVEEEFGKGQKGSSAMPHSNSSVERMVFPDATATLDFMLQRLAGLVETLAVYPDRMRENLELTRGLVFSGTLLLALTVKGLTREEAYALVQGQAMQTWDHGGDFRERVLGDAAIGEVLSKEEIERAFSLDEALRHVDHIFERTLKE